MNHQHVFVARLDRRPEPVGIVRAATLAATVLFASACAGPVLHTGSYERGGSAEPVPVQERYAPARLLAQAGGLELTAEQVAALGLLRDSVQTGRLTARDAALSAHDVLRPAQRRAVEADPRVRSPVPASAPPAPRHHGE